MFSAHAILYSWNIRHTLIQKDFLYGFCIKVPQSHKAFPADNLWKSSLWTHYQSFPIKNKQIPSDYRRLIEILSNQHKFSSYQHKFPRLPANHVNLQSSKTICNRRMFCSWMTSSCHSYTTVITLSVSTDVQTCQQQRL